MNELRCALRQLNRRPGLCALVILMLAVGVGATTAMFSLFHDFLVRPLPVPEPTRLVNLSAPGPKPGSNSCSLAGDCAQVFSYPMFRDLEARQEAFSDIAAHRDFSANLALDGNTRSGRGMLVSGGYFSSLGLRPAVGRLIGAHDEPRIGEARVVVLSDDYWRTQLGADPGVVGRTMTVNGERLEIVGVAPEGFGGTTIGLRPDVFVPLTLRWLMQPAVTEEADDRRAYWLYVFARLAPGVSIERAAAGINSLYGGILNEIEASLQVGMSQQDLERFGQRRISLEPGVRGQSSLPDNVRRSLTLLLGVTILVLLIVCANIANLLLASGASRAGEMAIRASIGAGRRQIASQLLAECTVLALIGGLLSVPIAAATLQVILAVAPSGAASESSGLSGTAMLFAAATTMGTVLLFGLVPTLHAAGTNPGKVAKGQASQAAGAPSAVRFRGALVTAQIGFSMVLLVLAGLFAQSLANIARIDLGMNVDSLVTFTVSPRLNGYSGESTMQIFDRIEHELASEPGVAAVASSAVPLLMNSNWDAGLDVEGFEAGDGVDTTAAMSSVSSGFFSTLSIPLRAGRDFTNADRIGSPQVAVVNESFVRKFNLGERALGTRFGFASPGSPKLDIEIVGVVADAKYSNVKSEILPQFFLARRQYDNLGTLTFYLASVLEPDALMHAIPRVVAEIDPNLPVSSLMTVERQVENNLFLDRLVTVLSAGFSALATVLAAVGLYGVLAYNVTQRTREFGLRLALGAEPGRLRGTVLKQVCVMMVVGGFIGLAGAILLGRAAETLLFGLSGFDPAVLLGAATVLCVAVLSAGYLPARRASRIAPMAALRYE